MGQIRKINQYKFVEITMYFDFSTHNIPSFRACSQILASLSSYQYTRKAWRKEAFELLLDSGFFQMDEVCVAFWRTILDNLMTHDKTTFKDLLGKEFIDIMHILHVLFYKGNKYLIIFSLSFVIFVKLPELYLTL